jgi:hypothetical protein
MTVIGALIFSNPEVISSSVGLVPTSGHRGISGPNFISCGSNARCHAGHRDQNRCYEAFGNQRNVPARIALPAAAKTTAVGLKAARSGRRKVSQSLRSLNLI